MPKQPLAKSMGTIQLMAHIIILKYADGLPLYRMEGILSCYGGDITRATMDNWVIKLARELQPLMNLLRYYQFESDIIQMDKIILNVLKEPGRAVTSDKYMWVSRGEPRQANPVCYLNRILLVVSKVLLRLLGDFSGYFQADGYAGYNAVCELNELTSVGC